MSLPARGGRAPKPPNRPLFKEVVEPAGAGHVAQHAVDRAALQDRHPGLRDGARSGQGDPDTAGEVQDVDATGGAFLAAAWEDLSLVIAWRQFMRDPRSYFRHLFEES